MSPWDLTPEGFHQVMKNFTTSFERLLKWMIELERLAESEQERIMATAKADQSLGKMLSRIDSMKKQLKLMDPE